MTNLTTSYCSTAKELSTAASTRADVIYIEGDLKRHVIRIKATGAAAWTICAGAIAVAVVCYLNAPGAALAAPPEGGRRPCRRGLPVRGGSRDPGLCRSTCPGHRCGCRRRGRAEHPAGPVQGSREGKGPAEAGAEILSL